MRTRCRILPLLACAAVLASSAAQAADTQGRYFVRGVGALKCSDVVRAVQANAPQVPQIVSWIDGAFSVANRVAPQTYDLMPFSDPPGLVATIVVNFCGRVPDALLDTAVRQVADTLRPVRLEREEAAVTITVRGNSVAIRPQTLRLAQNRLRELRLLTAAADGRWGSGTQAALRRFQESRQIPLTEIPDPRTVFELLLNQQ